MSVQGATGAAQWPDWTSRKPAAADPPERDDPVKASIEAFATKTAAPTRPATTSLSQQDFEIATRFGAGGAIKSLDQLVDAPKIDRRGWDPVGDRKSVNTFDRLADSLRAAALRRDAAPAAATDTTEAATAPAETTTATATPTLAYKPQTANEYGQQYVLNAIAAYQRNSNLTPTASPAPAQPAAPAPAPAEPTATTPSTPSSTEPAAPSSPPPAQPAPTEPTPSSPATTPPPASSGSSNGGLLGTLFGR